MSLFSSYCKIEESIGFDTSDRSAEKALKQVRQWVVTEKVHGANFSFIYSTASSEIRYAKRNGMLSPEDRFFQYQTILPEVEPKIQALCQHLHNNQHLLSKSIKTKLGSSPIETIIIYGELFGGLYPHEQVPAHPFTPIQKGIYYSPDIHFMAFDIKLNQTHFFDYEEARNLFQQFEIFHAEPLAIFPTYSKAVEYPLGFDSTIPRRLGLPPLPTDNKAEGIVVRSSSRHFLTKVKIPEFHEGHSQAAVYANNSMTLTELQSIAMRMILNENRLNSAISKIGSLDDYRYQIFEEMIEDVYRELRISKDYPHRKGLRSSLLQQLKIRFPEPDESI